MNFYKRLGYYLGGFSIGLIILAFFLSGKRTKCHYGPQARVLHNISLKKHLFDDDFPKNLSDSISVEKLLSTAKVDFSRSNTKVDSCKVYMIETSVGNFEVENCENKALFKNFNTKD